MKVTVLRTGGYREEFKDLNFQEIAPTLGCQWVEHLGLGEGWSMLVDEESRLKSPRPPINDEATSLIAGAYLGPILGDAAIVRTEDL